MKGEKVISFNEAARMHLQAHKKLRNNIHNSLSSFELTPMLWVVLRTIKEHPGLRFIDISSKFELDKPVVSNIISELEAKGMVYCKIAKKDKRAKHVFVYPKSIILLNDLDKRISLMLENMFKNVAKEELRAYLKVLQAIIDS